MRIFFSFWVSVFQTPLLGRLFIKKKKNYNKKQNILTNWYTSKYIPFLLEVDFCLMILGF